CRPSTPSTGPGAAVTGVALVAATTRRTCTFSPLPARSLDSVMASASGSAGFTTTPVLLVSADSPRALRRSVSAAAGAPETTTSYLSDETAVGAAGADASVAAGTKASTR